MSNGKPTPGPWIVISSDAGLWIEPPNRGEAVICDLVPRQTLYSAEDDANARLIAAAPDLLEALDFYVHICGNTAHSIDRASAQVMYDKGYAAIKKAAGDSQ